MIKMSDISAYIFVRANCPFIAFEMNNVNWIKSYKAHENSKIDKREFITH